jgi:hypothetical protein
MHSLGIGAAGGVNKSIAREWKGMAFSSCKSLAETKLHASEAGATGHESWHPPTGQTEVASGLDVTGQGLGEYVVRSVEKLRLREL